MKTLRLILGDQLNRQHSWFQEKSEAVIYVFMEIRPEATYVRHHIQKVIGFFLAMRHFAEQLEEEGHQVIYLKLDDKRNQHSFSENLKGLIAKHGVEEVQYLLPDEYRLDQQMKELADYLEVPVQAFDTEHFLTKREELASMFEGKKTYLMERFYRQMRKRFNILMEEDGETPLTGQWNYDASNRKKLPRKMEVPPPLPFKRNVEELVRLLEDQGIETIGRVEATQFDWPVTREENLELLDHFLKIRFRFFGDYQDAMVERSWLVYHARLSFAMNTKLVSPLEVVERAVDYWEQHPDEIDIAQVEGFVRQIIGWREYMRGIYWAKMPEYGTLNYFDHQRALPAWYWTGETKMNCLHHAITQSLDHAYAHHIQRLMVTGNFALLLGVDPDEVDAWYLGIYMDAIEWVEITNTRGMSQFADGGIVGTKPYASSANYIHKMSDYCSNCRYDKNKKYGPDACPFNSLYWDFYDRHADKLQNNPRIGMMYRVWERMDAEERAQILEQAERVKDRVHDL